MSSDLISVRFFVRRNSCTSPALSLCAWRHIIYISIAQYCLVLYCASALHCTIVSQSHKLSCSFLLFHSYSYCPNVVSCKIRPGQQQQTLCNLWLIHDPLALHLEKITEASHSISIAAVAVPWGSLALLLLYEDGNGRRWRNCTDSETSTIVFSGT